MKLAVFDDHRAGVVEGDLIYAVTAAVPGAGPAWPPMYMNGLIANWEQLGPKVAATRRMAKAIPLASVSLLPANYR